MSTMTMPAAAKPRAFARQGLTLVWRWLRAAHRTRLERRALAELDAHILADIGLDRYGVRCEADRPFWDLPEATWLHLRNGGRF